MKDMEKSGSELELPGFRFHPTEEELLEFYLRRAAVGKKLNFDIIGTLNLYLYDPWDLPSLAKMGEREWYFFVPRDRRQANGGRPNRTTERGFWKATGSDRPIRSAANPRRLIGLKKTLVYYRGRAPRGTKTDWVMNEYRLPEALPSSFSSPPLSKEDIVLCKIYRKATTMKELEHRAAMEEDSKEASQGCTVSTDSSDQETFQRFSNEDEVIMEMKVEYDQLASTEMQNEATEETSTTSVSPIRPSVDPIVPVAAGRPPASPKPSTGRFLPSPRPESQAVRQLPSLPALQVPNHMNFGWGQDSFLGQPRSPWLDQWSPLYASLLNF